MFQSRASRYISLVMSAHERSWAARAHTALHTTKLHPTAFVPPRQIYHIHLVSSIRKTPTSCTTASILRSRLTKTARRLAKAPARFSSGWTKDQQDILDPPNRPVPLRPGHSLIVQPHGQGRLQGMLKVGPCKHKRFRRIVRVWSGRFWKPSSTNRRKT